MPNYGARVMRSLLLLNNAQMVGLGAFANYHGRCGHPIRLTRAATARPPSECDDCAGRGASFRGTDVSGHHRFGLAFQPDTAAIMHVFDARRRLCFRLCAMKKAITYPAPDRPHAYSMPPLCLPARTKTDR